VGGYEEKSLWGSFINIVFYFLSNFQIGHGVIFCTNHKMYLGTNFSHLKDETITSGMLEVTIFLLNRSNV